MDQDFDNIKISVVDLWPTTIYNLNFNADFESIKTEIYKLSEIPNTIKKSNYGGWQSDVDLYNNPVFAPLCQHIARACYMLFQSESISFNQMWACINKKHDQNLIHSHGERCHFSGVFYVEVPENSGDIVFRDPRPSATNAATRGLLSYGDCEHFTPHNGQLLIFPSWLDHFVLPNESDNDRIAVSFDIVLGK